MTGSPLTCRIGGNLLMYMSFNEMYTREMTVTATEFRKRLFQTLERALKGEPIEITHHGRAFRLLPKESGSKLARLPRRKTLNFPSADLESTLREMKEDAAHEWERKWDD